MKKTISLILSFVILSVLIYPCKGMITEKAELKHIVSVSQEISQLCAKYDDYSEFDDADDKIIDNRLIVKADDAIDEYGAVDSVYGFSYAFLQYADAESAERAKTQYKKLGYTVDYDSVVTASSTESTYNNWSDEWAYEETDVVSALDYYKLKVKSTINIAVVDSGINYNHELFKNRVVRTEVDFSSDNSSDEFDTYGHGTRVAGVIAKSTPSNVKIYAYKTLNKNGNATSSEIISTLEYIKKLKNKPDIINCSFTTGSLGTVIDELVDMGITVIAGAGNDGKEVSEQPAIFDRVITVSAVNQYGKAWLSSNYGSCVNISASGVNVYTSDIVSDNAYVLVNGTSFATPLVSAAAAYVLMEHKNYTPEQVKQEIIATATPFKKSDCYNGRYGAEIVNFSNIIDGTRCKDVTANYISGAYRDNISVELKCANTLVDIYYTTDGTLPTKENGIKYDAPIDITDPTRIIACAYARAGTPFHSKFTYLDYYILKDGESEYIVDDNGVIKAYLGNDTNLVLPDVVNGIVPKELGGNLFKNSNIESIVLPDTVTTIGDNAFYNSNLKSITAKGVQNLNKGSFYGCEQLNDIDFPDLRYIGAEALYGCKMLTQDLELPLVNNVAEKGFAGTYFKTISLPECTKVGASAFEGCSAQEIVLKKASSVGANTFTNCSSLETIYIPQATSFGGCDGCTSLKTVFAPTAKSVTMDIPNNATIYCSDKLTGVDFPDEYKDCKFAFVSPKYTPGLNGADRDGYTDRFIRVNSDKFITSKGTQIRTRDNGLRFAFDFYNNNVGFDFAKYADTIDYGVVYTQNSFEGETDFQINQRFRINNNKENRIRKADNRNINGTVSTYGAVLTDIPETYYDYKLSARAYVNIDGMYFYSPVTTTSLNDVKEYGNDEAYDNDIMFEEHEHSYKISLTRPDCENVGYTKYTCKVCKVSYSEDFIDALGHNYVFINYSDGSYSYTCSECDKTYIRDKNTLPEFGDYYQTKVSRGNDNMYLDFNKDKFINTNDYAAMNNFGK